MSSERDRIDKALLVRFYLEQPLSVDKLPYTTQMDDIVHRYNDRHLTQPACHHELYQTLVTLRKGGRLVRKTKLLS